jgi:hypothetical protein
MPLTAQSVAAQVAFESKGLKTSFSLHIGSRAEETRRFPAMGQVGATCTAPPKHAEKRQRRAGSEGDVHHPRGDEASSEHHAGRQHVSDHAAHELAAAGA